MSEEYMKWFLVEPQREITILVCKVHSDSQMSAFWFTNAGTKQFYFEHSLDSSAHGKEDEQLDCSCVQLV